MFNFWTAEEIKDSDGVIYKKTYNLQRPREIRRRFIHTCITHFYISFDFPAILYWIK